MKLTASVRCGDAFHKVVLRDGRLGFPDHPGGLTDVKRRTTLMEFGSKEGGCAKVLFDLRTRKLTVLPANFSTHLLRQQLAGKDAYKAARGLGGRPADRRTRLKDPELAELLKEAAAAKVFSGATWPLFRAVHRDLTLRGVRSTLCYPDGVKRLSIVEVGCSKTLGLRVLSGQSNLFEVLEVVMPEYRQARMAETFRLTLTNAKSPGNFLVLHEGISDTLVSLAAGARAAASITLQEQAREDEHSALRTELPDEIDMTVRLTDGGPLYFLCTSDEGHVATLRSPVEVKAAAKMCREFMEKLNRLEALSACRHARRKDDENKNR